MTYYIITAAAAFILGVLAMRYYYNYLRNVKEEFFSMLKERPNEWHDTQELPCPGSLLALKHEKEGITFGYVMGMHGDIVVAELPKYLIPPKTDVEIKYIPLVCWKRWAYATNYIRAVDTLCPMRKKYEINYPETTERL